MSGFDAAYPWDDEPQHHTERLFRRTWRGMPLRSEWNAGPLRRHCQQCTSCGYRWDQTDFTYRGLAKVNGKEPPVMIHPVCWNCFMLDTQPERMAQSWASLDRPATGTKAAPALKALGGGR